MLALRIYPPDGSVELIAGLICTHLLNMNESIFDREDVKKLFHGLTDGDCEYITDIITLREHLRKTQRLSLPLPLIAYAYAVQFHPEVRNMIFISDLKKGWK